MNRREWALTLGVLVLLSSSCGGPASGDAGVDCMGARDGTVCGDGRVCSAGACVAAVCGNGVVEATEECDDANDEPFDGCQSDCTRVCHDHFECNNGDPCDGTETCSDFICRNGTRLGDGTSCGSGVCASGRCVGAGCGNGLLEAGEECDDGNATAGDGCEPTCAYTCALWPGQTNILGAVNAGFEPGSAYSILGGTSWPDPLQPIWFGDPATIIDGAQQGITPASGTGMLRFVWTSGTPGAGSTSAAFFAVDLASFAAMVATGRMRAHVSAHVNRVMGGAGTDQQFCVSLASYTATPAAGGTATDLAAAWILSDGNVDSWECVHTSDLVPPTARYLRFGSCAIEDVTNDAVDPEFEGHYADDVAIWFTMDP